MPYKDKELAREAARRNYRKRMSDPEYRVRENARKRAERKRNPESVKRSWRRYYESKLKGNKEYSAKKVARFLERYREDPEFRRQHASHMARHYQKRRDHYLSRGHFRDLKRKYDLTEEQFNQLNEAQGGVCAICGNPPSTRRKVLDVDHCHSTGKVRGLLCRNCNIILGHSKDDPERLRRAAAYLDCYGSSQEE